jgi:hypothetical protein
MPPPALGTMVSSAPSAVMWLRFSRLNASEVTILRRIATRRTDESERNAGAAAGILDDPPAGFQAPGPLAGLDHGERHAVLHAAGRIGAFELDQDTRATRRHDARQFEQRRIADALQNGAVDSGHVAHESVR